MTAIPVCPWRPAVWSTTDFVQKDHISVKDQAAKLRSIVNNDDDFIKAVATFVRDTLFYPEDKKGDPAAELCFKRAKKSRCAWFFSRDMNYAWSFPNEVLTATKNGICIDTANLTTSLLRAGGIFATTALGSVNNVKDDSVSGYHAWTEVIYKGVPSIIETTIHRPGADTILTRTSAYDRDSDWATTSGIYYKLEARYDEVNYEGVGDLGASMPQLMGLPAIRVQCYGVAHTMAQSEKRQKAMNKEWRKAEAIKHCLLSNAWGG